MKLKGTHPAQDAKPNDKASEHREHRMSRHHIGEQTDREADWPGEIGDDLDDAYQRQKPDGHARRHEQLEEAYAVLEDADQRDPDPDEGRQRESDDDVARRREIAEPGNGIMPSRFSASTNAKIVKITGKYFIPEWPAFCRTMFATNS